MDLDLIIQEKNKNQIKTCQLNLKYFDHSPQPQLN